MKKLLIFLLVACLAFSVAGCKKEEVKETVENKQIVIYSTDEMRNLLEKKDCDAFEFLYDGNDTVSYTNTKTGEKIDFKYFHFENDVYNFIMRRGYPSSEGVEEYKIYFDVPSDWRKIQRFDVELKKDGINYHIVNMFYLRELSEVEEIGKIEANEGREWTVYREADGGLWITRSNIRFIKITSDDSILQVDDLDMEYIAQLYLTGEVPL